ncbi:MAG: PolC-type DNA polymerase III [Catenisphaera adipataccumulans]|jgi:DNA polymerase-3 subunit epsilon|uniref:3'-5' exonuclease n=1 Tax=Catenisphaera adipataccumulans TaxID=700500 RepID=UPI003D90D232
MNEILTDERFLNIETYERLQKSFIAFDTETTGLSPENDVIIEVGAVKFENGSVTDTFTTLIDEGVPVPYGAYQVNHISTQMLRKYGTAPAAAYQQLIDFFGDALAGGTLLCAHNANFDMGFLSRALSRYDYSGCLQYIDTLKLSRRTVKGLYSYSQGALAQYFQIVNPQAHRAAADAETCGRILDRLLSLNQENIEQRRIDLTQRQYSRKETAAASVIVQILLDHGCPPEKIRLYRTKSNYVEIISGYRPIKIRIMKKKSYVIVPAQYISGQETEPCTKSEGTDMVRLLFHDPAELMAYRKLIWQLHLDSSAALPSAMEPYERRFLKQADLDNISCLMS